MYIDELENFPGYEARYLVEYDFSTGIEDKTGIHPEIFPNPATDSVTIKTDEMINRINIYSLNGQKMIATTSPTIHLHQQTMKLSFLSTLILKPI